MNDEYSTRWSFQCSKPPLKVGSIGVGRERLDLHYTRSDVPHSTKNSDRILSVDDLSSESAFGLVTDEQHSVSTAPNIVYEMMFDATAITHASSGNNDRWFSSIVERLRLVN